jgi:hypothetical protein
MACDAILTCTKINNTAVYGMIGEDDSWQESKEFPLTGCRCRSFLRIC